MVFVNDAFDRDGSDSEISWLGESVTSNKTKNYFEVIVNNNGRYTNFMVADLKQFSDLQTVISQCYPHRNRDELIIDYLDKDSYGAQIKDSKDFEIFLEKHKDQKIYVTWVKGNSTPINGPVKSDDTLPVACVVACLLAPVIIALFATIALYFGVFGVETGKTSFEKYFGKFLGKTAETVRENRVDHWSGHKKIIRDFCQQHPSTEECQRIIVEFLSFIAHSFIEASI